MSTRTQALSFHDWLMRNRHRDDPIGDLAQDTLRDRQWPQHATELLSFELHLIHQDACRGARAALRRAWREWQAET